MIGDDLMKNDDVKLCNIFYSMTMMMTSNVIQYLPMDLITDVSKYFFQPFSVFFVHFKPFFRDFTSEINKKCLIMNKTTCFFSYFVFSSKLVDMQKLVDSLRGYLNIIFFWLIYLLFSMFFVSLWLLSLEKEPKRFKTAEKSCSTSSQVSAAPESWSKYTTQMAVITNHASPCSTLL